MVSYEKMSEELAAAFAEKYPRGLVDYFNDTQKIQKPDGTVIHTVTVEIPDAIYLVKVAVPTDDADDVTKWMDEQGPEDNGEGGEGEGESTLPDDNIAQYSNGEDDDSPEA